MPTKVENVKYDYSGGRIELRPAGYAQITNEMGQPESIEWKEAVLIVEGMKKVAISRNAIEKLAELHDCDTKFCDFLKKL